MARGMYNVHCTYEPLFKKKNFSTFYYHVFADEILSNLRLVKISFSKKRVEICVVNRLNEGLDELLFFNVSFH